ncbi:MAG: 4-amino-4-deoxy-L-arabinose transferase [Symploca sp. SIO1C4]|uniref:4-amino-4-deoxy-L-arabinose transferase n=1 Tax=Symploca sp. SIO1C4 TaxID=2607765 RepID=A0A6B3N9P7_9CYAN|nr:4-amino-4-deoxy-L-arabinose transferase [Symploca sp. SIO1C4]
MLVVIPLISLALLVIIFENSNHCWRRSILSATVVWSVFLATTTEFFSFFKLLKFFPVLGVWVLFTIGLAILYSQLIGSSQGSVRLKNPWKILKENKISLFPGLLLGGVVLIVATVGLIALVAPPNTWDSMTYHMSRVVHWIQNHSLAHYPTYNLPQLFHPPFAEFTIMHLQMLSGGDRFANLVQWFAMVGSIMGVSLIAKELKADVRGQIFAAVFCATIPMGILQGSSTQNDYVVTFWLVCLAYYVLLAVKAKNNQIPLFFIGASLGLATLTKSSAYVFAFPFMLWFGFVKLNHLRLNIWKPILVITAIFMALNINHYLRNLDLFGSLLGTPKNFALEYKIEVFTIPTFLSNVLKNLSLHVDIVRHLGLQQFITPITGIVAKILGIIHSIIGVELNDPRITSGSYTVPGISFDENTAGNPLHLFMILAAVAYCLIKKNLRNDKYLVSYLASIIAGFFIFCLLLKIQPYQSRHHLIIFVLVSAFVGLVLSKIKNHLIINTILIVFIFTSMPWVFNNKFRPINAEANIFNLSRTEQYFINRNHLKQPYVETANFVLSKECSNVGLSLGTGETVGNVYWEYPFWPLLQKNKLIKLEHINPQNISNKKSNHYPHNKFVPCAIISVKDKKLKEEQNIELVLPSGTYVQEWSTASDYITVLTKR